MTEHDGAWAERYLADERRLFSLFGAVFVRVNHIGSTAVPGLLAKPTIDILAEVAENLDLSEVTKRSLDEGYVVKTPRQDLIMYLKGYTPRGFVGQAFHIHVRNFGDWGELYFRDYLREHEGTAAEYAALKTLLKERLEHDRDGYTDAKTAFVKRYTALARQTYLNRYEKKRINP